ncbi:hypothetical protein DYB37_000325 [Aphanomyces astaci]|uniref:Uncharacterized protein n=1 Tax=Aphanomyces astaci TaxID=112090 RepID=A0A3R7BUK4_APHAT|nr:hypothetical protein DYB35_007075 [Aphanomyces astaci]RHZ23832.1 hypothetical protein DYB37_000325 [Aphanomyces astaci]
MRRNTTTSRRFNTGNPQGPAEGATAAGRHSPTPPSEGELKWARRLNELEKKFKGFSTGEHAERHWGYKGPFWGFLGGVFVGCLARPGKESKHDADEFRRLRNVARDLQDESWELKNRLTLIQQSIDQLRVAQHQQVIPPRSHN